MRTLVAAALSLFFTATAAHAGNYLFVWGMETRDLSTSMPPPAAMGRDFLAVFDVAPRSRHFGKLIAMLPVGTKAQMAHHTNYDMPDDGLLFASDYMSGEGYAIDLKAPASPKLVASFSNAGPYTHAHSFARLANGDTLATYQFRGQPDHAPGALVELDQSGHVVRASDASDAKAESFIRPYSLVAVPLLDRVVTTSAPMLPTKESSHVLQVWRLSDLKLLKTVILPVPPHFGEAVAKSASEPRLLADGKTVLVVTAGCGLYRVTDLASDDPAAEFVYDFGYRSCGVPTVSGHYWLQATTSGRSVVSLDVSDPGHPKHAGELFLPRDSFPHWLSHEANGNRIVITGFGSLSSHALFATLDRKTGALTLDRHSIDFDRKWPDGWNGPAMPHGALFSR